MLTWKMFTEVEHTGRKWDTNFKTTHPSLCQPNLLQEISKQDYTEKKSTSANLTNRSNLIVHFKHLQTIFKYHSSVQSPRNWAVGMKPHLTLGGCHPHHCSHGCSHSPWDLSLPMTLVRWSTQGVISADTNQYYWQASVYLVAILSLDEM